jgi:hypothetical protein
MPIPHIFARGRGRSFLSLFFLFVCLLKIIKIPDHGLDRTGLERDQDGRPVKISVDRAYIMKGNHELIHGDRNNGWSFIKAATPQKLPKKIE